METTEYTPEHIDEIGGNPHAEIPPKPPADFRTDPRGWFTENVGAFHDTQYGSGATSSEAYAARAFDSLSTLLDSYDGPGALSVDAEPLAVLLSLVKDSLSWRISEDPCFILFGPILVPTTPRGLETLAVIRNHAGALVQTRALEIVDSDSATGKLLAALASAESEPRSGMLETIRNTTSQGSDQKVFQLGLNFHSRSFSAMPAGTELPTRLLSTEMVGMEVNGDTMLEMMRETDACSEGAAEWLEQFGIGFEREGGIHECDECGTEHESEESGEIESISDVKFTSEMVDALDRQGYGDVVREFLASEEGSDTLSGMLAQCDDSEILERCAPDEKEGILYDTDVWAFDPDFQSIDGIEDLDTVADTIRAGALFGRIVDAHSAAGILPPIGGTLRYLPDTYEKARMAESARKAIGFAWDPISGMLQCRLGSTLSVQFNVKNGARSFVLHMRKQGVSSVDRTVALTAKGSQWVVNAPGQESGTLALMFLGIHQGTAGI